MEGKEWKVSCEVCVLCLFFFFYIVFDNVWICIKCPQRSLEDIDCLC